MYPKRVQVYSKVLCMHTIPDPSMCIQTPFALLILWNFRMLQRAHVIVGKLRK